MAVTAVFLKHDLFTQVHTTLLFYLVGCQEDMLQDLRWIAEKSDDLALYISSFFITLPEISRQCFLEKQSFISVCNLEVTTECPADP